MQTDCSRNHYPETTAAVANPHLGSRVASSSDRWILRRLKAPSRPGICPSRTESSRFRLTKCRCAQRAATWLESPDLCFGNVTAVNPGIGSAFLRTLAPTQGGPPNFFEFSRFTLGSGAASGAGLGSSRRASLQKRENDQWSNVAGLGRDGELGPGKKRRAARQPVRRAARLCLQASTALRATGTWQ